MLSDGVKARLYRFSPSLSLVPTDFQNSGVSVVIPTFKGRHLLERFLPSVIESCRRYVAATDAPVEILLVDDGGGDDTAEWLAARAFPFVRLLPQPVNRGFAPTCNVGFREARFPVVWLLNNDIETTPDALAPLVAHFADPNVFAVSCRALRLGGEAIDGAGRLGEVVRGFWKVFANYDVLPEYDRAARGELPTMTASGGYSAFDREKLVALGGFEELLAPFYWEDVELCYRAWKRGWDVRYEPASLVFHQMSATIGKRFAREEVEVVATRNRILMHWIHLHDARWWAMHWLMIGLLWAGDIATGKTRHRRAIHEAWARRNAAFARRREERAAARRSDRELVRLLAEVTRRPGVRVFRTPAEEAAFRAETRKREE